MLVEVARQRVEGNHMQHVTRADVSKLAHVARVILSDNPLHRLPLESLPRNITELSVQGCNIKELPKVMITTHYLYCVPPDAMLSQSLVHLGNLHILNAGANEIESIDVLLQCPSLQHAGLAYNSLRSLPTPASISSPLISLDMSHNRLCNAASACSALTMLPRLRSLGLSGNPMCLMPGYESTVRSMLQNLKFLDQLKLDGMPPSRPAAAEQQPLAAVSQPESSELFSNESVFEQQADPGLADMTTSLQLEIADLKLIDDSASR